MSVRLERTLVDVRTSHAMRLSIPSSNGEQPSGVRSELSRRAPSAEVTTAPLETGVRAGIGAGAAGEASSVIRGRAISRVLGVPRTGHRDGHDDVAGGLGP